MRKFSPARALGFGGIAAAPASWAAGPIHKCGSSISASSVGIQQQVRFKFTPREKNRSAPWTDRDALGSKGKEAEASVFQNNDDAMEETSLDEARVAVDELCPEELVMIMSTLRQSFNPVSYALVTFPCVDIILLLHRNNLLPKVDTDVACMRYLLDPKPALRRTDKVEAAMGRDRYLAFAELITKELHDYNVASPIHRALRKHNLPADLWAPVLRGLVIELTVTAGAGLQYPAVILALAGGKGAPELNLHTDLKTRVRQVADLAIASAQEFGVVLPADIALQLLKANGIDTDRAIQKSMTQVMSRGNARDVDWKLRESGLIKQIAPSWIAKYSVKIAKDIAVGLSLEDVGSSSGFDELLNDMEGEDGEGGRIDELLSGNGEDEETAAMMKAHGSSPRGRPKSKKKEKSFTEKMAGKRSSNASDVDNTSDYFARQKSSSDISDILSKSVDKKLKLSKQELLTLKSGGVTTHVTSNRKSNYSAYLAATSMSDTTEL